MYQEDREAIEHRRALVAIADERGTGQVDAKRDDWLPEDEHGNALGEIVRRCYCPDDCSCHYPWRANLCGCKGHA